MNIDRCKSWFWPICLSLFLIGCSDGGGSDSYHAPSVPGTPNEPDKPAIEPPKHEEPAAKPVVTIDTLERDGLLPLLDRTDSMAGVDTDGNGVRDDIETWIVHLPLSGAQKKALLQLAAALQKTLFVDVDDEPALREVAAELTAAVSCAVDRKANRLNGQSLVAEVRNRTANTEIRARAYIRYTQALDGFVFKSPDGSGCHDD